MLAFSNRLFISTKNEIAIAESKESMLKRSKMFSVVVSCVLLTVTGSPVVDSALPLLSNDGDSYRVNDSCSQSPDGDEVCPVWFVCGSNNTCECGSSEHKIMKCNQDSQVAMVLDCYCVTYNEDTRETFAGACFINCAQSPNKTPFDDKIYKQVEKNVSELNSQMCGSTRAGRLCGECRDGYYPKAYSYDLTCMPCKKGNWNWAYFILAAYGPLTLFYFFALLVKLNISSPHLQEFVFVCQTIGLPEFVHVLVAGTQRSPAVENIVKAVATLCGIWNLDFFRAYITKICLRVGMLEVLALDYTIAVYPLILTVISYCMIELYDRNVRVLIFLWKPFRYALMLFKRKWDVRTSIIDAYSTFFMLSYVKFLSVSFNLLMPTIVYKLGSNETSLALYYSGDVQYFGKSHLPFAILALSLFLTFNIFPMVIMFLYQFRWFQNVLFHLPIKHHILDTFMDTFQGYYKNGMEPGTRDCRWFSAMYLLVRVLCFMAFALSPTAVAFVFFIMLLLTFVIMLLKVQPYKANFSHYMPVDFILLLVLLLTALAGYNIALIKDPRYVMFCLGLAMLVAFIALLHISVHALRWIFARRQFGIEFVSRLRALRSGYALWENGNGEQDLLPDRLQNPHNYQNQNLTNFNSTAATVPGEE